MRGVAPGNRRVLSITFHSSLPVAASLQYIPSQFELDTTIPSPTPGVSAHGSRSFHPHSLHIAFPVSTSSATIVSPFPAKTASPFSLSASPVEMIFHGCSRGMCRHATRPVFASNAVTRPSTSCAIRMPPETTIWLFMEFSIL